MTREQQCVVCEQMIDVDDSHVETAFDPDARLIHGPGSSCYATAWREPAGMKLLNLSQRNVDLARAIGKQLVRSLALRAEIGDVVRDVKIDAAVWVRNERPGDRKPSDLLCFRFAGVGHGGVSVVVGLRSEDEATGAPLAEPDDWTFVTVQSFPTTAQAMQHLQSWRGRFDNSGSVRLLAEFVTLVAKEIGT